MIIQMIFAGRPHRIIFQSLLSSVKLLVYPPHSVLSCISSKTKFIFKFWNYILLSTLEFLDFFSPHNNTLNFTYIKWKLDLYLQETITTIKIKDTRTISKASPCPFVISPSCSFPLNLHGTPPIPRQLLIEILSLKLNVHFLELYINEIGQYVSLCLTGFFHTL